MAYTAIREMILAAFSWKRPKTAYRGMLVVVIPLGLLMIFVGLVVRVKQQSEAAQVLSLHSTEVLRVAQSLLTHIAESESAVRGFVLNGDVSFKVAAEDSRELVRQTMLLLQQLVADNAQQTQRANNIAVLTAKRIWRITEVLRLVEAGNARPVRQDIEGEAGPELMKQLRMELTAFSEEEARLGAERQRLLDSSWQRLTWLLVSGTAAAWLLAGVLTHFFSSSISRRLRQIRDNAHHLAAGEPLPPPITGGDELAELDQVFHEMAGSLARASMLERVNRIKAEQSVDIRHSEALLKTGALQSAIFNSANFSSIATDAKGVIQIFNVGAERMLGYLAAEMVNTITPADISDSDEVIARAKALSIELDTPITPGFEALVFKASRGIEDIYELTYIRKDGSRFPAVVSVTALRDGQGVIIGYLLIGTDNTARKKAEAELLKAGALQSAIFNSANFSSIATDEKGVIQIFNVGAERMLGYVAADVMNKITPADISDPLEVIARAKALSIELGTPITPGFEALVFKASRGIEDIYELTYIRKDGSRLPAVVSVTALRASHDQGAIIGYLLIGTDNTARKQAEAALLKAGALQSAIFNSANFSSIATDERGVIQIFNVGAERMLGYAAADVTNKITPADISDPEEVVARAHALSFELSTTITPGFEALVFKASRGIEDIYQLTYIRKDGSRFPAIVSVTALRDSTDGIIGYLLIGTDNTARKQVEAEQKKLDQRLRDQQFYTRSLIESNIDALITTDPLGIITDVNKQMEALTGCTRDELIGAPFKDCFTDPQLAEAGINLVLSEKKVTNYELTARARDGKETVVSYNATTFYDRERRLQGVFAAARDVTERKRFELALQETNVELALAKSVAEKASLAKSDFLSSMSHELRSPLNAILGFAQLMESSTPLPAAPQLGRIKQILQAGWHLLRLINEILDLAVIESGQMSLSKEAVSVSAVMADCQAMMGPQAEGRGIRMTFPHFSHPVFVHADVTRLKQVVINLLSNAIKYNKENGEVVVECSWPERGRVRISVRDTGAGLAAEKISQLFQPFNRLGQEASGVAGTGIGLVVTKRLAELMDGSIGVESIPGLGSVFWCDLNEALAPEFTLEHEEELAARPIPTLDAARHLVLCIEDNHANMELIVQLIGRFPHLQLITAVNGTLGIELARSTRPQVILMDINLPDISGTKVLQILRDDQLTAHIPVVAVSANALPRDIAKGLEAGFFRYLAKPIKVTEFVNTVHEAIASNLNKPDQLKEPIP